MHREPTTAERWTLGVTLILFEATVAAMLLLFCQTSTITGQEVRVAIPSFIFGRIEIHSEGEYVVYTEGPFPHATKSVEEPTILRAEGRNANGSYQSQIILVTGKSSWEVLSSGMGRLVAMSRDDWPVKVKYNDGNVLFFTLLPGVVVMFLTAFYALLARLSWLVKWHDRRNRRRLRLIK